MPAPAPARVSVPDDAAMPANTARPLITSRTAGFRTALRLSWCHYLNQPETCRHLLRLLVSDHVNCIRRVRADRHACQDVGDLLRAIRSTRAKHSYFIARDRQQVAA